MRNYQIPCIRNYKIIQTFEFTVTFSQVLSNDRQCAWCDRPISCSELRK